MKPIIKRLARDELRIIQIAWIAKASELLASCLPGHTAHDVDSAIEHAVNQFVNTGIQPAAAVAQGVLHAKTRMQHRDALQLCALTLIKCHLEQPA